MGYRGHEIFYSIAYHTYSLYSTLPAVVFARLYRYTVAQVHRCTDVQMYRCTGTQVHRCTDAQVYRCTGVQVPGDHKGRHYYDDDSAALRAARACHGRWRPL